jgi:NAD(P)-dependent dehydrogenase (short-subunit alcohol dehydrogenase family)
VTGELRFEGRVVVVTGAGRGIGREHALLLGARGAQVVVNDVGCSPFGDGVLSAPADDVAEEITASGGTATACYDTIATEEGASRVIQRAVADFGRVDVLIHNAGVVGRAGIDQVTSETLDRILAVHLKGGFFLAKAAWPVMVAQGYGRILTTTSAAGLFGMEGNGAYAAAKMGLVGLTRTLAHEGAAHGIQANSLSPAGNTRLGPAAQMGKGDWAVRGVDAETDLGPRSMAALGASVAAWLSHESCAVTGQVITAAGRRVGRVMIAETTGIFGDRMTPEDIKAHWNAIVDPGKPVEPGNLADWTALCAIPGTSSRFLEPGNAATGR